MTKAKPMTPKSAASTPKGNLKGVKDSPIGKNKTPKFKATPTGKVALINGTPKGKMNKNEQKNTPKGNGNVNTPKKGNSPNKQNTPKQKNVNQKTPQGKKNTPKGKSPALKQGLLEEQLKAKVAKIIDEGSEDSDEDDEDINEGVHINEEVSEDGSDDGEDEDDSDEESSDVGVTNILGNSLADDSEDDDDDFDDEDDEDDDDDEDEENGEVVNKGVKMFKGLKPGDDEEEEDEDDSDDDEDEGNQSGPGLKALLGTSLADDDDDEDFEEGDEDDEDEEISDDEEDEDEGTPVKRKKTAADDDEEEEDSEDEEDDVETAKLATLDEDDDEEDSSDGDGEEADSEGDAEKPTRLTPEEKDEKDRRTIYIGNVPKDTKKSLLMKMFKKFGEIESLRFRGVVPGDNKMSPKVATITRKIHPNVTSVHVYITFKNMSSATKALAMNGQKLGENFLRIDLVKHDNEKPDLKKAVFLGNLPFRIEDNDIWSHFGDCGKILSVRVVKDRKTGIGKGFGYINFDSADAVTLALKLNGTALMSREIRVKPCTAQAPKNAEGNQKKQMQQKPGGKRPHPGKNHDGSPKKFRDGSGEAVVVATHNSKNAERRKDMKQNRSQGEKQRQKGSPGGSPDIKPKAPFQGQKADNKKKQKTNKGDKKKKQMAGKLAAKPKKPVAN